jgi:hypothetical protein
VIELQLEKGRCEASVSLERGSGSEVTWRTSGAALAHVSPHRPGWPWLPPLLGDGFQQRSRYTQNHAIILGSLPRLGFTVTAVSAVSFSLVGTCVRRICGFGGLNYRH